MPAPFRQRRGKAFLRSYKNYGKSWLSSKQEANERGLSRNCTVAGAQNRLDPATGTVPKST